MTAILRVRPVLRRHDYRRIHETHRRVFRNNSAPDKCPSQVPACALICCCKLFSAPLPPAFTYRCAASRKIALAVVPVNRAFAFNSCDSGVGNRIVTLVVIHANVGEKRLNASSVWRLLTKLMYHLVDQMFPQKYWTLACTLAVAIIAAACGDAGSTTHYYDPAVLRGRYLPTWDG